MSNPPGHGHPGQGRDPLEQDPRYSDGSYDSRGDAYPPQPGYDGDGRYYDASGQPYDPHFPPAHEQWPAPDGTYPQHDGDWDGAGWSSNEVGYDGYTHGYADDYPPVHNQSAIFQASYGNDVDDEDEANNGESGRDYEPAIEPNPDAVPITGYPQDDPRAFIRLTVAHESSRTDLILPGNLPVTDIMPSLIRRVITVTPQRASGGFVLANIDGTKVDPSKSFIAQGVEDGVVLTLASRVKQEGKKYDDLVEAIADSVEATNKPWTEQHSASMAIGTSVILVLIATILLANSRAQAGPVITIILGLTTAMLLGVAWALKRSDRDEHAVALALTATLVGFAAGATGAEGPFMELPVVFGGLTAAVLAFGSYPFLGRWHELLAIPAFTGLVLAIVGGLNVALDVSLTRIALGTVAVLGITQLLVPLIAWRSSKLEESDALLNPEAEPIDPKKARQAYLSGHRFLFASRIGVTLATLVLAPYIVAEMPWSLVLLGAVALILALSTRRAYAAADVVAGYVCALAVFTLTFVLVMRLHPEYWLYGVLTLLVLAGLLVAFGLFVKSGRTALRRVADAAEVITVLALIPAAVLAMRLW